MTSHHDERDVTMVQECVDLYDVKSHDNGSVTITIEVPTRFADLWLLKLAELRATDAEIRKYETGKRGQVH